jgi:hypothetical protein
VTDSGVSNCNQLTTSAIKDLVIKTCQALRGYKYQTITARKLSRLIGCSYRQAGFVISALQLEPWDSRTKYRGSKRTYVIPDSLKGSSDYELLGEFS